MFRRKVRRHWGTALDLLEAVYLAIEEFGSGIELVHAGHVDPLTEALLALHARVCLITAEVHWLLSGGFPLGALARARSVHEAAVIAEVLSVWGRESGFEDLADRFLAHAVVDEARDLNAAVASGLVVSNAERADVEQRRDDVESRYGSDFLEDYGWARPLFPDLNRKARVQFSLLEKLADIGLDYWDYRLASHQVHASARSLHLGVIALADGEHSTSGPGLVDFAVPASIALRGAAASIDALVRGVADLPEPMQLVGSAAIEQLAQSAAREFGKAQRSLE